MNEQIENLIKEIKEEIKPFNFSLTITKGTSVLCDGSYSSGYFCEDEKKIKVAGRTNHWIETLCHEFAHFIQWRDGMPYWKQACKIEAELDYIYYWGWVNRSHVFPIKDIYKILDSIRDMEAECERVSYNFIKKKDLPIDLDTYAKRANAYIHFYNIVKYHRTWYKKGKSPFKVKKIINSMPNKICSSFKRLPKDYEKLILKYCL